MSDSGIVRAGDRRRRNREEVVTSILNAARAVMLAEGVGALNLQEVARRVGMRAPSLYEYFPGGKSALYDAIFRLGTELFAERIQHAMELSSDPWEQLGAAMEAYMTFATEHPELYQLVFERPVPGFVPSAESLEASRAVLERAVR